MFILVFYPLAITQLFIPFHFLLQTSNRILICIFFTLITIIFYFNKHANVIDGIYTIVLKFPPYICCKNKHVNAYLWKMFQERGSKQCYQLESAQFEQILTKTDQNWLLTFAQRLSQPLTLPNSSVSTFEVAKSSKHRLDCVCIY